MENILSYMLLADGLGVMRPKFRCHAIGPATAVSGYKAQGKAMERCLPCFNKPPETPFLSYESAFVCMSRVKFSRDFKVMPLHSGGTWDHMLDLHPPNNLVAYLNGFMANGTWSPHAAKAALDEAVRVDKTKPGKKNQKKDISPKTKPAAASKKNTKPPSTKKRVQRGRSSEPAASPARPTRPRIRGKSAPRVGPPTAGSTLPCLLKYPTTHLASLIARRRPTSSSFTRK
mmetsp:Transcript_71015/g.160720  ORF Transcript_71015/g.160720 Transcript_71015/m.160720 type:complete len:230 (-) Transcript_71015:915-1604(-)